MNSVFEDINILGRFCGPRDIKELTQAEIKNAAGKSQADVMVLFGGSIIAGGDVFAEAMQNQIAKTYIIVGGAGHTTQTLRNTVHALYADMETENESEAVIFNRYIKKKYGLSADYLETESTNCGNNITFLLKLLNEKNIKCGSIILCQDATMQKRMEAVLRKYAPEMKIINYAAYQINVNSNLKYTETISGMWDFDRYLTLLMGEIPRLTDDENGYGPKGKNFIAHVEIPEEVRTAYEHLKNAYNGLGRDANPLYAG
ncbi:MAG: YdcF family protein [Treponemataceae bacterium]|nr:YdcF family protein [Treponemataceae bacterium]